MPTTTTAFEDIVMDIIIGIYASTLIPESHKPKYVEYIKAHGMTEKMLLELQKIFTEEERSLSLNIEEKENMVKGLEIIMAEEQKTIDRPMAEIVASVDSYLTNQEQQFKENLKGIEDGMAKAVENVTVSLQKQKEEEIKKKLGIKNK